MLLHEHEGSKESMNTLMHLHHMIHIKERR
jgi:hypothetical protein